MTTTVTELFDGRTEDIQPDSQSVTAKYVVSGAADEAAVRAAVVANVPAYPSTNSALTRRSYTISERVNDEGWIVDVTWTNPSSGGDGQEVGGDPAITFDTGGGTQTITQSLGTTSYAAVGVNKPDFKGAINFDGERVNGAEITVPTFQWSETHRLESVTPAYFGILFAATGKINDDAFRGFAAGEVLLLGVSGNRIKNGEWDMTFRFSAQENKANVAIGDITVTEKRGWDFIWIRYKDSVDAGAGNARIQVPNVAYVEEVYEEYDFDNLALPDWTT